MVTYVTVVWLWVEHWAHSAIENDNKAAVTAQCYVVDLVAI